MEKTRRECLDDDWSRRWYNAFLLADVMVGRIDDESRLLWRIAQCFLILIGRKADVMVGMSKECRWEC